MINDQILSAWLCFFVHQTKNPRYKGWEIELPFKVREELINQGLMEAKVLGPESYAIRVTEKGMVRATLDAGDWGINSLPETR